MDRTTTEAPRGSTQFPSQAYNVFCYFANKEGGRWMRGTLNDGECAIKARLSWVLHRTIVVTYVYWYLKEKLI